MAKTKHDAQKKLRVLTRARDFYTNTLCGCGGGTDQRCVINCTVPQTTRKYNLGSSKEIDHNEDLRDLMRLLSMRKGGGATVDVDSEGNLVWRKQAAETSYGGGVGRIGRIDEDKPCCFNEVDVNKFRYSRGVSNANRRNLVYI